LAKTVLSSNLLPKYVVLSTKSEIHLSGELVETVQRLFDFVQQIWVFKIKSLIVS